MLDMINNKLLTESKVNYKNDNIKCLAELKLNESKVLIHIKICDMPMFNYIIYSITDDIYEDFLDKYCKYLNENDLNDIFFERNIKLYLTDVIELLYRWKKILNGLIVLENLDKTDIFNQYLELIKFEDINTYKKIERKKDDDKKIIMAYEFMLNYLSSSFEELTDIKELL